MDINDKIAKVVCQCKTLHQLDCAVKYVRLANKANLIGIKRLYFSLGTIAAFKAILKLNSKEVKS